MQWASLIGPSLKQLNILVVQKLKWNQALPYHPSPPKKSGPLCHLSPYLIDPWDFKFFGYFLFNFFICYYSIPMGMGVFFMLLINYVFFFFLCLLEGATLIGSSTILCETLVTPPNKKHIGVSISSPLPKIKSQRWFVLTHLYNLCTWKFNI